AVGPFARVSGRGVVEGAVGRLDAGLQMAEGLVRLGRASPNCGNLVGRRLGRHGFSAKFFLKLGNDVSPPRRIICWRGSDRLLGRGTRVRTHSTLTLQISSGGRRSVATCRKGR